MAVKLVGLEAETLLKLDAKEEVGSPTPSLKASLRGLEKKNLVAGGVLTEEGHREAAWRKEVISRVEHVYDVKAGGGYRRDIHFVYEPVTYFSYAWNWCGLKGVSVVQHDPKRKQSYFKVLDATFWLEDKTLTPEELTFNMPTAEAVEAWSKGNVASLEERSLWRLCKQYFTFFLDLKEPAFYDVLGLAAFQTWLLTDETLTNSCFFVAVKGAYGGGKSVSCEALIFLGRHGKIANPSIAWLGRSIERLGLTIFMDEFDVTCEQDPELGRLARMCQRRGQSYDRSTKSGKPESFQVFAPWIMSVHGELEDALATRTLPVTTLETSDSDIPVVNPEKVRLGQQLYDQMWMWYLDSIDYISYKAKPEHEFDLSMLGCLVDSVDTSIVTIQDDIVDHSKLSQPVNRNGLGDLRRRVADTILSTCTEKQVEIIKESRGRNVELMVNAFKIANIVGVDLDASIKEEFKIKTEVEEEEREIGLVGYLRDFLVDLYRKRREHPNYWTSYGPFMVSNKETFDEFNIYLHRQEQSAISSTEFKGALRELGFERPTGRKKMKIKTWSEIEADDKEEHTRLANIYTEGVCRRLGLTTKMPDFARATLQEKMNAALDIIIGMGKATGDAVKVEEICRVLQADHGVNAVEAGVLLATLERDGRIYRPKPGCYRAVA